MKVERCDLCPRERGARFSQGSPEVYASPDTARALGNERELGLMGKFMRLG